MTPISPLVFSRHTSIQPKKMAPTSQHRLHHSSNCTGGHPSKNCSQQIRTTKIFRITKRRILYELQSDFKRKGIRNFSSHQQSPNENEVLTIGLNFFPTPSASTHHLIQKSATRLTQTMKKQFHFKNQPLTIKRPTECKPFTRIPPEPNSYHCSWNKFKTLSITTPQHTTRPNLTSQ